jgi:hypothetical protein
LNERYLRLPSSIGLMLIALLMTAMLAALKSLGMIEGLTWARTLVEKLDLSDVLLNGVLCFMLFAGSAGVEVSFLRENEWPIRVHGSSPDITRFQIGMAPSGHRADGIWRKPNQFLVRGDREVVYRLWSRARTDGDVDAIDSRSVACTWRSPQRSA